MKKIKKNIPVIELQLLLLLWILSSQQGPSIIVINSTDQQFIFSKLCVSMCFIISILASDVGIQCFIMTSSPSQITCANN